MLILILIFYPLFISSCMLEKQDYQSPSFVIKVFCCRTPRPSASVNKKHDSSHAVKFKSLFDEMLKFESEKKVINKNKEDFIQSFMLEIPNLNFREFTNKIEYLQDMTDRNELENISPDKALEFIAISISHVIEIKKDPENYLSYPFIFAKYQLIIKTLLRSELFQRVLFGKDEDNRTIFDEIKQNKEIAPLVYELFYNFNFRPNIISHPNFKEIIFNFKLT